MFGNFELGDTTLKLKAGQHNIYWGEGLYTAVNGVSAGQGPIDTIKASTSPGAEVKELFLPLDQVSAQWQLNNEVSLNAQYLLDWKPFRLVPGGTYFAGGDGNAPCAAMFPTDGVHPGPFCLPSLNPITPGRNGGDYGLALHWAPEWFTNGTMGFYYRKYDEKLPWSTFDASNGGIRLVYGRDTEMFGFSASKAIAGVSVAGEISYRKNTALNSTAGYLSNLPIAFGGPGTPGVTPGYAAVEGARGDTYHALLNGIWLMPKTALWEGGTLTGEVSYQRLDKVTKNPTLFHSEDHACKGTGLNKGDGCSTKDAWTMSVAFTPQWTQVLPGWDLDMPVNLTYGLKGNGPTIGGGDEGAYNWSIGLTAKYGSNNTFSLAYIDSHANYKTENGALTGNGQGVIANGNAASYGGLQNDHGWLSFTYKTSF